MRIFVLQGSYKTMESQYLDRLMNLHIVKKNVNAESSLFGSKVKISNDQSAAIIHRIGMWPLIADDEKQAWMGLWSLIAVILENGANTRVYRLFSSDTPEELSKSSIESLMQFTIDDWSPETLNENIAIWGNVSRNGSNLSLVINIESDMWTDEDEKELSYSSESLSHLLSRIPEIVNDIVDILNLNLKIESNELWKRFGSLEDLNGLRNILAHEIELIRGLWVDDWNDEKLESTFTLLLDDESGVGELYSQYFFPLLRVPGYQLIADVYLDILLNSDFTESSSDFQKSAFIFMFNMGYGNETLNLLSEALNAENSNADEQLWMLQADFHLQLNDIFKAIDTLQTAIEVDMASAQLYTQYGRILSVSEKYGYDVEEFLLIDPDEHTEDTTYWEANAAFGEALALDTTHKIALQLQCELLSDLDQELFWDEFKKLIDLDQEGDAVRYVIDRSYAIDDWENGIQYLNNLINTDNERLDARVNLAQMHIYNEQFKEAESIIDLLLVKLDSNPSDLISRVDLERMLLVTQLPNFEATYADIEIKIASQVNLDQSQFDFLHDVCDIAPHFISGYIMLAKAYLQDGDNENALDIINIGLAQLPAEPNLLAEKGRVYANSGKFEKSLPIFNEILQLHPTHVTTMLYLARTLFDEGYYDETRTYIGQLEQIAPNDSRLSGLRKHIARNN